MNTARKTLEALLSQRILVLDGAMGTMVQRHQLTEADFRGTRRKLLMQASRNGYFFVLDRTTGQSLLTTPFATVNWAKGVDANGSPIPNPDKEPARDGRLVAPDESGGTNYRSPAFDPADEWFD